MWQSEKSANSATGLSFAHFFIIHGPEKGNGVVLLLEVENVMRDSKVKIHFVHLWKDEAGCVLVTWYFKLSSISSR